MEVEWSHIKKTRHLHKKTGTHMELPGKQKSERILNYLNKENYESAQRHGIYLEESTEQIQQQG